MKLGSICLILKFKDHDVKHVLKTNHANRAFESIESHFYNAGNVCGLKVYPK